MARPLRITYPGAYHHILSRGNTRASIFREDADRKRFLVYLEEATRRYGIVVHAFCLMDNHYHLLVETSRPNISRAMQYVNTGYTAYFNARHQRIGHLLQGRYKSIDRKSVV